MKSKKFLDELKEALNFRQDFEVELVFMSFDSNIKKLWYLTHAKMILKLSEFIHFF